MWSLHALKMNFQVVCGISQCVTQFTSQRSFVRDIKAKHSKFFQSQMKEIVGSRDDQYSVSTDDVNHN